MRKSTARGANVCIEAEGRGSPAPSWKKKTKKWEISLGVLSPLFTFTPFFLAWQALSPLFSSPPHNTRARAHNTHFIYFFISAFLLPPLLLLLLVITSVAATNEGGGGLHCSKVVVGGQRCDVMLHPLILRRSSHFCVSSNQAKTMAHITAAILRQQDDLCNAVVLDLLRGNGSFKRLAASEGESIIRRDKEDDEKLAVGIEIAKAKGILTGDPHAGSAVKINTVGKTAQEVTDELIPHLPSKEGNIIIIQGLSGTGKGTTVKKLQAQLPRCVTWSNGNVFRGYTYLCLEELKDVPLRSEHLNDELLQRVQQKVTFEKLENGEFDIVLKGNIRVGDVQNTLLKTPEVGNAVPTVAQQMQGEVIRFAAMAVGQLSKAGHNVILEGRAQTLNYIPTSLRFELVMDNPELLGERRAAQRVAASVLHNMKDRLDSADTAELEAAILNAIIALQ